MPRTTPLSVKLISDTNLTDDQLAAFIDSADVMIGRLLVGHGYTETELSEICTWLAAHLIAAREKPIKSQSVGGASESYDTSIGLGLDGTFYGQQVKLLETEGILAGRERRRASVSWVGR